MNEPVIEQIEESESILEDREPETAGAKLLALRTSADLSIADVAAKLRVSVDVVQLLESDVLDSFPSMGYVRALARGYCRALNADAEPILGLYPQTVTAASAFEPRSVALARLSDSKLGLTARRRNRSWWVLSVVIMVVGAALVFPPLMDWIVDRQSSDQGGGDSDQMSQEGERINPPTPVTPSVDGPRPDSESIVSSTTPPSESGAIPIDEPLSAVVLPVVSGGPSEVVATSAVLVEDQKQDSRKLLTLAIGEKSWVGVTNADGVEILNTFLNDESRDIPIEGRVNVVIGNPVNAKVYLNGEEVDLQTSILRNVARIKLGTDE